MSRGVVSVVLIGKLAESDRLSTGTGSKLAAIADNWRIGAGCPWLEHQAGIRFSDDGALARLPGGEHPSPQARR
jgi:hypothetical protein